MAKLLRIALLLAAAAALANAQETITGGEAVAARRRPQRYLGPTDAPLALCARCAVGWSGLPGLLDVSLTPACLAVDTEVFGGHVPRDVEEYAYFGRKVEDPTNVSQLFFPTDPELWSGECSGARIRSSSAPAG
jgi:hypothetical protein